MLETHSCYVFTWFNHRLLICFWGKGLYTWCLYIHTMNRLGVFLWSNLPGYTAWFKCYKNMVETWENSNTEMHYNSLLPRLVKRDPQNPPPYNRLIFWEHCVWLWFINEVQYLRYALISIWSLCVLKTDAGNILKYLVQYIWSRVVLTDLISFYITFRFENCVR